MTIRADVRMPDPERPTPFRKEPYVWGWWVKATVVLEAEPRSELPLRHEDGRMKFFHQDWHTPKPEIRGAKTYDFMIDSGAEITQLGTDAIRDLGLTVRNTKKAEGIQTADGSDVDARGVNGELWMEHIKPALGKAAYSVFRVQFIMAEEDLNAAWGNSDRAKTDSLIGQDILDFMLAYGGMQKRRPTGGRSTPILFDIKPNWKDYRRPIGMTHDMRGRRPYDASSLWARKQELNRVLKRVVQ